MIGVIEYVDKDGKEKSTFFHGMRYDETPEEYLKRRGIEYEKILNCYDEE